LVTPTHPTTINKILGGASRDEGHYDDFWFLKIEKRDGKFVSGWKPVKDFLELDPRTGLSVTYHQNTAYIFGGQNFLNNAHSDQFYKLKVDQWVCELILTFVTNPKNYLTQTGSP
jgi:hypothetical protein